METSPERAGMDPARLERVTDHLERRYIQPGKIAGCQTLVARRGHIAYFVSQGMADRERGVTVAPDTIFRIYSMTKPVTSVALMALYEEGHFQLTDPVHRFIPELGAMRVWESGDRDEMRTVEPLRPMTVRDVLMHTSGLSYGFDPTDAVDRMYRRARVGQAGATLESMVTQIAEFPLKFHPGTRWSYSYSTDVCARLVEVMSGQRFDEFLASRIFGPLKMSDTGFTVPEADVHRFAATYTRGRDKTATLSDDPQTSAYLKPRSFLSGGAGLVSTSADYLRFCQMLLNGGELDGARVLGRKTIELMTASHLPGGGDLASVAVGSFGETGFDGVGFGLGFAVTLGPVETQTVGSAGSYYWGGAASTTFWIDPSEDLIVIFMVQLMPSGTFNFRGQLHQLVYPAIVD